MSSLMTLPDHWLATLLWQATLCLLAGGIASRLWSRQPARAHCLMLTGMIGCLVVPLASILVHQLGWGMLVGTQPTLAASRAPAQLAKPTERPADSKTTLWDAGQVAIAAHGGGRQHRSTPLVAAPTLPTDGPLPVQGSTLPKALGFRMGLMLASLWGLFSAVLLARWCRGLLRGRQTLARARQVEDPALKHARNLAVSLLGLRIEPRLVESADIVSPVIWCWSGRPVIVLPRQAVKVEVADWVGVFCHELAHWRRRDHWSALYGDLLLAVLPWHPLAWWSRKRLTQLAEQSCDDWVATLGRSPVSYADSLLQLLPQRGPGIALAAVGRHSQLHQRVQRILARQRTQPTVGGRWAAAALGTSALLASAMALAQSPDKEIATQASPLPITAEDATLEVASGEAAEIEAGSPASPKRVALPGLLSAPASRPGVGRWQLMTLPLRGFVAAVAWSPDGNRIAFGDTHHIRICDAKTLRLIHVLVGHVGAVTSLAWAPNGQHLVSSGVDGTVRLWTSSGAPVRVVSQQRVGVYQVAFDPEGTRIASAGGDGVARVFGLDGKQQVAFTKHNSPVRCIAWSPDGQWLASGDNNRTVRLWQADGNPGSVLAGHFGPVVAIAWSPDGKQIVSASRGVPDPQDSRNVATLRLWGADGTSGPVLRGHTRDIVCVEWDPTSQYFASVSDDRTVRIWNRDGQSKQVFRMPNNEQRALAWSPDGKQLAVVGRYSVQVLDASDGTVVSTLGGDAYLQFSALDWKPDSQRLVTIGRDGMIRIWSTDGASSSAWRGKYRGTAVAWSPDGDWIAAGSYRPIIQFWKENGTAGPICQGHRNFIESLSWHPSGKRLASASRDGSVRLWDLDGSEAAVLPMANAPVLSVAWCPDGQRLASGDGNGSIQVWRKDGTRLFTHETADGDTDALAWSPDGKRLASGHNGPLRLWSETGDATILHGHVDAVLSIAWSPNGMRLASGGWDATVRLWNANGTPDGVLRGHEAPVLSVGWSPNGKWIASTGFDRTLRLHDARSRDLQWLAIVLDGGTSATFGADGELRDGDRSIVEEQIVYLVEKPDGAMELLTPSQFQQRIGQVDNQQFKR